MSKADKNRKRKADAEAQAKRDSAHRCLAEKRSGQPCMREAGWGTDHPGTGRCKDHGGTRRAGQVAAAAQEMSGMAKPLNVTPGMAMDAVMRLAAGQLVFATMKVADLDDDELYVKAEYNEEARTYKMMPHKWVALQDQCMQRLARYAKLAADAGIAERQTSMQEAQTAMVAELIERVLGEVGLSEKQRTKVGPAIRRHLVALPGGQEAA